MQMQMMKLNHHQNADASDMTEVMPRKLSMRITLHQYQFLMTNNSHAHFESASTYTKSFELLFGLIHFLIRTNLIAMVEKQLGWLKS